MLPMEDIKEIINYVINIGIEKGMSVSVNFYADNVEVSAFPIIQGEEMA